MNTLATTTQNPRHVDATALTFILVKIQYGIHSQILLNLLTLHFT